jgi:hypothetical protein
MCIICVDLDRGSLKRNEARRALREMGDSLGAHAREVEQKVESAREEEAEELAPATIRSAK